MSSPCALLVASLGNPGPLSTTRHSAGHILLKSMARHLNAPPFSRSQFFGSGESSSVTTIFASSASSTTNPPTNLTLWQSPSLMNRSGPAVLAAWRSFCREHNAPSDHHKRPQQQLSNAEIKNLDSNPDRARLGLVLLHDDLETPRGTLKLRHGLTKSTRGHNGLKSVFATFSGVGIGPKTRADQDWVVRIAIGIGRPKGDVRGREDVSEYVLAQCTEKERETIEGLVWDLKGMLGQEKERIVEQGGW